VEDEHGICYFLKLADYCKESKKEYQKEWQTSQLLPKIPPMSWEMDSDCGNQNGCMLTALCGDDPDQKAF
jgi:hypothetical protein